MNIKELWLTLAILGIVSLIVAYFVTSDSSSLAVYYKRMEELKKGNKYLYSLDWDESNPFDRSIDTATVLDIQEDYVLFHRSGFNDDFKQSLSASDFISKTREIK